MNGSGCFCVVSLPPPASTAPPRTIHRRCPICEIATAAPTYERRPAQRGGKIRSESRRGPLYGFQPPRAACGPGRRPRGVERGRWTPVGGGGLGAGGSRTGEGNRGGITLRAKTRAAGAGLLEGRDGCWGSRPEGVVREPPCCWVGVGLRGGGWPLGGSAVPEQHRLPGDWGKLEGAGAEPVIEDGGW